MGMDKNIMCVISFFLGMLIFHLLKGYCGCNNVVEGQTCTCASPVCIGEAGDTSQGTIDGQACAAVTDEALNDATACDAIMTNADSNVKACTYDASGPCTQLQTGIIGQCSANCYSGCSFDATNIVLAGCNIDGASQLAGPGGTFCNATGCCPV